MPASRSPGRNRSIYMRDEEWTEAQTRAKTRGVSVSEIIRGLLVAPAPDVDQRLNDHEERLRQLERMEER